MKRFGMIAAVEIGAVKKLYGEPVKKEVAGGFDVYTYVIGDKELFVLHSGVGEIAAASATQVLISDYKVECILNFGIVGGLTEEMSSVPLCVVEKVVHYPFDTSAIDHCEVGHYIDEYPTVYMPATPSLVEKVVQEEPSIKKVICASGDKFVDTAEEKTAIHKQFNADICEMEAAGIVKTANKNGIPCLCIKMVADTVNGGAKEYEEVFDSTSETCLKVMDKIMHTL